MKIITAVINQPTPAVIKPDRNGITSTIATMFMAIGNNITEKTIIKILIRLAKHLGHIPKYLFPITVLLQKTQSFIL